MEGTTPNSKGNTALKVITTCFHSDFEFFPFITLVFLRLYINNRVFLPRGYRLMAHRNFAGLYVYISQVLVLGLCMGESQGKLKHLRSLSAKYKLGIKR